MNQSDELCVLELMTTEGCHLCDQAVALLLAEVNPACFAVDLVDIAYDDTLMERYAVRIPVLRDAKGAELDWPFGATELRHFLAQLG